MKPVVIDLCCGLGGWTKGFLAEGYDAYGFDIERHVYGEKRYPAQLILQDIRTLDGRQFRKHASVIVASPPCQKYSYMAMPFGRCKIEAAWQRYSRDSGSPFADPFTLNELVDACKRIAREAELPLIMENVKGAQPWIGRAAWHFGSYYLWGDLPALMPSTRQLKQPGRNFHFPEKYGIPSPYFHGGEHEASVREALALKTVGHANIRDGYSHTRHLTNQRESDAVRDGLKHGGDCFNDPNRPGKQGGIKQNGSGPEWFDKGIAKLSSRSDSRKAASAMIAEIPFDLSQWIARCFKP